MPSPKSVLINIKKMKNKLFFAILFTFSLISNVNAQKSKPNILFIAVDDLKPELGAYGNKLVKTPNIDRLAKMSTVFLNNYCQQAVCGPTRASLMTGMRPDYTKIWDLKTQMRDMNPNIVTLPQYLITQGYNTVGTGKIFHPSSSIKKIDPVSWSMPYMEPEETDYANNLGKPANGQYQKPENKAIFAVKKERVQRDNDDEEPTTIKGPSSENYDVPDNAYDDGLIALMAKKKLIEFSKNSKPYFMAVGFRKPHLPFVAPKKYWDLYNRADMPLATYTEHAKDAPEVAYHKSGELRNYIDIPAFATFNQPGNHVYIKEEKQKELIHGYYAAVSYMDAQVGILLNTLDSLGTLNNTIIVLWGDHGWHLGDHDLWEKHTNMEQATRAPLIVAAPGMKAGKSNSLSEHLDIFPTICDLAGLNVPSQLQGKSLKPIMQNNSSAVKDFSVSQYPRKLSKEDTQKAGFDSNKIMGYSLRTSKYRFTIWMNDFTSDQPFDAKKIFASEMYDYNADPLEKVNVYTSNNYKEAAKEMYSKMVNFFKSQESK
jgi:arylsulfatase A-like enzyme